MDPVIANMAKLNYFDAAHYTWIKIDRQQAGKYADEYLNELLVANGDYATPLRTEYIRQPFDNMALVLKYNFDSYPRITEQGVPNDAYIIATVECHQGLVQQVTMWSDTYGSGKKLLTVDFVAGRDESKLRAITNASNYTHAFDEKGVVFFNESNIRNKTLVSFNPAMPPGMQKILLDAFVPLLRSTLRYISAASAGLLAGEQPTFHRPTGHSSNAKRVRKGKAPLYEWTTVQLERKTPELPAAPAGGTHASPRLHQRRGHWVTSKLGKKFWRRESVVGDPEKGMIFHDYKGGETNAQTQA